MNKLTTLELLVNLVHYLLLNHLHRLLPVISLPVELLSNFAYAIDSVVVAYVLCLIECILVTN